MATPMTVPTLLTPTQLQEIRERHAAAEMARFNGASHVDRAALLSHIDALERENAALHRYCMILAETVSKVGRAQNGDEG